MKILSIDFDFFFPVYPHDPELWQFYDWGHQETSSLFYETLWYNRAAFFIDQGKPIPGLSGEQEDFWDRFMFTKNAKLYIADSHRFMWSPEIQIPKATKIISYDAHHDAGYQGTIQSFLDKGMVDCATWAMAYGLVQGTKTEVRYPRWKKHDERDPVFPVDLSVDDGSPENTIFSKVFLCRSGAWVPPWVDNMFMQFIYACPIQNRVSLQDVKKRNWSQEALDTELEAQNTIRNMIQSKTVKS